MSNSLLVEPEELLISIEQVFHVKQIDKADEHRAAEP
jgi:hypothetical protein